MRNPEALSQISDDESHSGICNSCRLAVNKDTGRLKWCMGGNDVWRTRIRCMLLIPIVILPIVIIIIALSKSNPIGKMSVSSLWQEDEKKESQIIDDRAYSLGGNHRKSLSGLIYLDADHSETGTKKFHPQLQTSFLAPESTSFHHGKLFRLKRDVNERDLVRKVRTSEFGGKNTRATQVSENQQYRDLQVNFSRQKSARQASVEENEGTKNKRVTGQRDKLTNKQSFEDGSFDEGKDLESSEDGNSLKVSSDDEPSELLPTTDPFDENEDDEDSYEKNFSGETNGTPALKSFWNSEWNEINIRKAQAKLMLQYMDTTADPCQDFYQYACGNWKKYNPIPQDKNDYDTFEILKDSLNVLLKELLEEPIANDSESAVGKAKIFFQSCMNSEVLEQRLEKPLIDLLNKLGGWPILDPNWSPNKFDWVNLVAQLRLYNNDILISEWVAPDIKNSNRYIIQIDQTTLGLPTRDYFLDDSNTIYLMAYKNYIINVVSLLGASRVTLNEQVDEMIEFEIDLAKITMSVNDRHNISKIYERMTLQKLQRRIPQINWYQYLTIVLNRSVSAYEKVIVFATKYLQDLAQLISRSPPRTVANYLFWRFAKHRVNNLDDRFQEAKQTFYYILLGREKAPSRWKNCIAHVNGNLGMAVGSLFVRKYFDKNSKNDTLKIAREIQEAFRELLYESDWLDLQTKRTASEKIDTMQLRIGYPDYILSEQELDDKYKQVQLHPERYFENTLNILEYFNIVEQRRIGTAVNKTSWNTAPAIVNAYYNRNTNQIMFPAGILQPPFYHKYFPKSLNYGGIGVVIGHEITHGFDDKGRLYDKYGNLNQWWSSQTVAEFNSRAHCLIDQYNRYHIKEINLKVNGANTQGENIADNGGIKEAFKAYKRWLKVNGKSDERMPGMNATEEQLFFLNFAQVWCGSTRPESMKTKIKVSVHAPGEYRVIGTLSNFKEFAQAFNCPAGARMNPEKKCTVW